MCRRVSPACAVCAAERLAPRASAHAHSRTRGGLGGREFAFLLFLALPLPDRLSANSAWSAPVSAILGKLHKNKPSGLLTARKPGRVLREARRGPAAAVRAKEGAGRGPGRGPRRRGVSPRAAPRTPGRVRARACVRRAAAAAAPGRQARVGG